MTNHQESGYQVLESESHSHDETLNDSRNDEHTENTRNSSFIETMKEITTVNRLVSLATRATIFLVIIAIILIWGYTKLAHKQKTEN
ncbi:Oidioi.mRNA.OKI2018_I69.chr2.g7123.t1.cds [Oikopleura dioica]|uniref:Oidioi.mRNA.OKI2018_I69.chr2.g7123.t1.cds n=1 Tax=Oikopleura dioica TaxID=34765 RepID=A0ABN7T8P7_OIKDI|nr:Oidioi.mRNA.OKI2018_I69.chr2.g7123.t1.cds [Oikopleura dioica]